MLTKNEIDELWGDYVDFKFPKHLTFEQMKKFEQKIVDLAEMFGIPTHVAEAFLLRSVVLAFLDEVESVEVYGDD